MAVSDIHWNTLLVVVLLLHLQCLQNPFVQACGGTLTSSSGVLTSPSYPSSYPNNMDCTYVITQPSGYFITLTFTVFSLQTSVNCSSDFLEIRNGGSSVSPILGTRLCGSQLPPVQRTTRNQMWMRFKTDYSVTNSGFQASYTRCGGSFTSSSGVLTSPSYPSSYPNNMDCTYVITQPSGYFVTLTFTVFSLQLSVNCTSDFLEIRNGGFSVSPLLGTRLCGSQLPPVQRTIQNIMWMRFKTDNSVTYNGFQANYTTCGGNFTGSSGVITSPSYPQSYQDNLTCVYTITQSQGLPIALFFEDFDTEGSSTCSFDYVEIRDGNSDTSPLLTPRLCGPVLPPVLCSTQRYMRLLFRTDGSAVRKGFRATYSVCGGNFTESSGIIRSPSYPNNYPDNIDYSYIISQTDGYFIYLNFMDFSLEYNSNCLYDYVEIRDGDTFGSPVLGNRLCGFSLPPVQRTTQNFMWIRFKTDVSNEFKGFQASYTTCGGIFTSAQGYIQSPSYPSNYPSNMDCVYLISQQSGYHIYLNFTNFMLQSGSYCLEDYVEIRDGRSATSPLIGNRLCGSSIPPIMRSTQNVMRIHFKTNYALTYSGFKAMYHVACGSVFTLLQSSISFSSTLHYYLSGQECVYVIAQRQGYRITLNFTKFNLTFRTNCTSDYVEVLDGESPNSPILGSRFCGVIFPPVQRSTQNTMSIRFKIDLSSPSKGFQAFYIADVIPREIVLMTDDVSVIHMDLETRSYSHISTTNMQQPMGVDYDPVEDRVYWTDIARGEIWSSLLNNTDFRMVNFLGRNSRPYGIAVDTVSRLIFYTEARNNTIGRLTMSDLSHKLLVSTNLDEPRAIAVHKISRLIFWTQVGMIPKIERANYDASDRITLVSASLIYPSAIALDVESNQLFWVDSGTHMLGCTNLEGNIRKSIYLSSDKYFVGITIFGNHLYLIDWGRLGPNTISSYVRRMDKDGQNESIVATFTGHLHNIRIYSERSQNPESNSNTSNDSTIVIGATCGVAALAIIIIVSIIVVIKWRKAKGMTNRNTQPTITVNTTYDGLNRDKNGTSRAEGESSVYATIEEHRAETHQIDNHAYSGIIGSNKFLNHPVYKN